LGIRLREVWGQFFRANYASALEREVARLRAENRALLNSILGIAGVPPIVVSADDPAAAIAVDFVVDKTASDGKSRPEAERGAGKPVPVLNASTAGAREIRKPASTERGMKSVAAPMRRRSWHQVYRMLEIDAARKKEAV
jgi:hypothetical protein